MKLLNNYGKILKVLLVTLFSVLLLWFILYVYGVEVKHPYEYGYSVWKCSDPNIELMYKDKEETCIYYSPTEKLNSMLSSTSEEVCAF